MASNGLRVIPYQDTKRLKRATTLEKPTARQLFVPRFSNCLIST